MKNLSPQGTRQAKKHPLAFRRKKQRNRNNPLMTREFVEARIAEYLAQGGEIAVISQEDIIGRERPIIANQVGHMQADEFLMG